MRIPYQALLSIPLVLSTTVMANDLTFNSDFQNVQGQFEHRDFHINLTSSAPIHVSETYQCTFCSHVTIPDNAWAEKPFGPPHITGNDSSNVTLDWSLSSNDVAVGIGKYEHIGFKATSQSDIAILEAHWTPEDLQRQSVPVVTPNFFGFFEGEDKWLIARVNLFSDEARTQHIGTMWAEGQAESLVLSNFTHTGVFATVASFRSTGAEPLANLNDDLTPLLRPETVIGYVAPVPEPETYAMLLAGLGLLGWRLRRS